MTPDELATLRRLVSAWRARALSVSIEAEPAPELPDPATLRQCADDLAAILHALDPQVLPS